MAQSNKRMLVVIVIVLILAGLAYVIINKHTDPFTQSEIGAISTTSTTGTTANPATPADTNGKADGTPKTPTVTMASVKLAENVTGQLMKVNSVVLPVASAVSSANTS